MAPFELCTVTADSVQYSSPARRIICASTRAADCVSATLVYSNPPLFRCVTVNGMFGYRRLRHEVVRTSVRTLTIVSSGAQVAIAKHDSAVAGDKIYLQRDASDSLVQVRRFCRKFRFPSVSARKTYGAASEQQRKPTSVLKNDAF